MQPTRHQIQRFFKRECTPREAEFVHRYLTENPAALEEYLGEKEWQEANDHAAPGSERTERMLHNISKQIAPIAKAKVFRMDVRWINGIAACICLVCFYFLWKHLDHPHKTQPMKVAVANAPLQWRTTANVTRSVMHIMLDDGSHVALDPRSVIRYTIPFERDQRDIHLTGEAKFYVAKDKQRPFTVYAGPLATTALGTVFKITAWPKHANTKVRLLSGKVKVVPYQRDHANALAVYLLPGKELVFNNRKGSAQVSAFNDRVAAPAEPVLRSFSEVKGDTLNFVNQQLPLVIDRLQEAYHIRVDTRTRLKKYYFTGQFNSRTESAANVLQTITSLNKLQYVQLSDSTYLITKP
jgi:transmembrane sensor